MGDKVFVKVTPYYHMLRFGQKGKLALRFVRFFEILKCIGKVACQLTLLMSMNQIYNVLNVSLLHKYISDPTHVLRIKDVEIQINQIYEEYLIQILDKWVKQLKNKQIPLVKFSKETTRLRKPSKR